MKRERTIPRSAVKQTTFPIRNALGGTFHKRIKNNGKVTNILNINHLKELPIQLVLPYTRTGNISAAYHQTFMSIGYVNKENKPKKQTYFADGKHLKKAQMSNLKPLHHEIINYIIDACGIVQRKRAIQSKPTDCAAKRDTTRCID